MVAVLPSLVVDGDSRFLSEILADSTETGSSALTTGDHLQAVDYVKDPARHYAGIFLNPDVSLGKSINLLRSIRAHHPTVPVFLLYDGERAPFSAGELRRMAVHGALRKPIDWKQMRDLMHPLQYVSDVEDIKPKDATLVMGLPPADSDFLSVSVREFLSGAPVFFDVYVRLDSGRFLKVLKSGTSFSEDRLQSYMQKGLTELYLKRSVWERCLGYCEVLERTITQTEGISDVLKTSYVLSQGEILTDYIKQTNILGEREVEEALDFIVDVHQMLAKMDLRSVEVVDAYMRSAAAHEHAVGTTLIALLVAKFLGMKANLIVETVGLAALLHDVGLYDLPKELHAENIGAMTPEQLELYHSHSDRGAFKLSQIETVPAVVVQAVAQHHERRDGKGFPKGKVKDGIHRVSEIVAISADCVRLLQKEKISSVDALLERMQETVFNGYTFPIVTAFLSIFGKKMKGAA